MIKDYTGKTVLITGGSSGIGLALAHSFGARGATLVLNARNADRLIKAVAELQTAGYPVHAFPGDVSKQADCEALAAFAMQQTGRIDVLINNAGMSMRALFAKVDMAVIEQLMGINFFGAVYATKACLPAVLANKGSIVMISSIAGLRGLPGRTGYCASKAALNSFAETLRTELLRTGVHVLLACPGFTSSNIRNVALSADGSPQGESPLDEGAIMPASEVAEAIVKAVQRRRRDLILTREGKLTATLSKFFPAWLDELVYKRYEKEGDL